MKMRVRRATGPWNHPTDLYDQNIYQLTSLIKRKRESVCVCVCVCVRESMSAQKDRSYRMNEKRELRANQMTQLSEGARRRQRERGRERGGEREGARERVCSVPESRVPYLCFSLLYICSFLSLSLCLSVTYSALIVLKFR